MIIKRTSPTPRTDAIMDCIDKSNRADTREHCYALQEAARNGIEALEREIEQLKVACEAAGATVARLLIVHEHRSPDEAVALAAQMVAASYQDASKQPHPKEP